MDEENNKQEKFFDAVGNLLREVRYTIEGGDIPPNDLTTDYRYDNLYRLIDVKTPESKYINYQYDCYSRQKQRTTPYAGTLKSIYDDNNNLRFTQDQNQFSKSTGEYMFFAFRRYDALNRVLAVGDLASGFPGRFDTDLNGNLDYECEEYSASPNNFLIINVYDTLSSAIAGIFSPPADYYGSASNHTKGNLVATAYRTRGSDNWNFKYYRYDARGRVIRMWNILDGLGTKATDYEYNSQNQDTLLTYQNGQSDYMRYYNLFDDAGWLAEVWNAGGPMGMENFCSYSYNENSQVSSHNFDLMSPAF